jgi:hypothetical protein
MSFLKLKVTQKRRLISIGKKFMFANLCPQPPQYAKTALSFNPSASVPFIHRSTTGAANTVL